MTTEETSKGMDQVKSVFSNLEEQLHSSFRFHKEYDQATEQKQVALAAGNYEDAYAAEEVRKKALWCFNHHRHAFFVAQQQAREWIDRLEKVTTRACHSVATMLDGLTEEEYAAFLDRADPAKEDWMGRDDTITNNFPKGEQ